MTTIQQLLTDHMDIWAAANTEKKSGRGRSSANAASVYGIKKLRELILELAVRGKLVPQDPKDEPASELLKRIQAEKAKLIAGGKIKKAKPLAPISDEEKPFELPQSWEWVRLDDLMPEFQNGASSRGDSDGESVVVLRLADIKDRCISLEEPRELLISPNMIDKYRLLKGDILIVRVNGSADLVGGFVVCEQNLDGIYCDHFIRMRVSQMILNPRFLALVGASQLVRDRIKDLFVTTAGQKTVNQGHIGSLMIPLLNIAEQHRIVAKVDELMALCDQLETKHNNAAEAHEKLVSYLLGTLTHIPVRVSARPELVTSVRGEPVFSVRGEPVEPRPSTVRQAHSSGRMELTDSPQTEFEENWQRIATHFDTLFTTQSSIAQLKQTLLQLAVMGKLVPQNPNDEPASELFKRIQAEKAKLIAAGKIKKDNPLSPITDDEKPFELPQGWQWVRLGELVEKSGAGWSPNCEGHPRVGNDWGVLKVSAVSWDKFLPDENKALPKMLEPRLDGVVETGDFLVSRANTAELVAKSVVVEECPPNLMLSDKIVRLRLSQYCDKRFINNANSSSFSRSYYSQVAGGTSSSMKNVSREQILNLIIGKPPLAEQHRIVAKVDEIMALCDQLKLRITAANQLQQKLADVMIEQDVA